MNDPHVAALLYTIENGPSVDYLKAEQLEKKEPGFCVKITNQRVRFEFKEPYATVDAARNAIEDYVRAWEFSACLESGPDSFKLKFHCPEFEDRKPTPGVLVLNARPVRFEFMVAKATVVVSRACYPPPPSGLKFTPYVQLMYEIYMLYRQGRARILDMAYVCYTMAQNGPKFEDDFSEGVRDKIKCLYQRGGAELRKRQNKDNPPLTDQERGFLAEAIKVVILRAAERAHDPERDLPKICRSNLPPLKSSQQNCG